MSLFHFVAKLISRTVERICLEVVLRRCWGVAKANNISLAIEALLLLWVYQYLGTKLHKIWMVEEPIGKLSCHKVEVYAQCANVRQDTWKSVLHCPAQCVATLRNILIGVGTYAILSILELWKLALDVVKRES